MPTEIKDLNSCSLKIKKPVEIGNNTIFKIFDESNGPFVTQSRDHYLIHKTAVDIYDRISFFIQDNCKKEFEHLNRVIMELKKRIENSKYYKHVKNKTFLTCYRENTSSLKVKGVHNIPVFDLNKNRIELSHLSQKGKFRMLLHIESIWATQLFCGINILIFQIQVTEPLISCEYGFKDESIESYEKMLKLGIPILAIKQKMQIDNMSDENISKLELLAKKKIPPPPPPRPPPPCLKNALQPINRKTFAIRNVDKPVQKSKPNQPNAFAPSLEDVLKAKHCLKSCPNRL